MSRKFNRIRDDSNSILLFFILMWILGILASGTITILIILALLRYITGCG